jgi:uncharacterized Rmd1/YagE family protein
MNELIKELHNRKHRRDRIVFWFGAVVLWGFVILEHFQS